MLCWFLLYNNVSQPYILPLPLESPSYLTPTPIVLEIFCRLSLFLNFAFGVFWGIDVLNVAVFQFINRFFYGFCILNLA